MGACIANVRIMINNGGLNLTKMKYLGNFPISNVFGNSIPHSSGIFFPAFRCRVGLQDVQRSCLCQRFYPGFPSLLFTLLRSGSQTVVCCVMGTYSLTVDGFAQFLSGGVARVQGRTSPTPRVVWKLTPSRT